MELSAPRMAPAMYTTQLSQRECFPEVWSLGSAAVLHPGGHAFLPAPWPAPSHLPCSKQTGPLSPAISAVYGVGGAPETAWKVTSSEGQKGPLSGTTSILAGWQCESGAPDFWWASHREGSSECLVAPGLHGEADETQGPHLSASQTILG